MEEQRLKLHQDIQLGQENDKKAVMQAKLNEQRNEFMHKMKVIDEIRIQKAKQEEQDKMVHEAIQKREAEKNKYLSQNFKD